MSPDEMAEVPAAVVTVTLTDPVPEGATAEMEVDEFTVKDSAGDPPKETAVVPVKPVPVIVTTVAPVVGPKVGVSEVTVGGAETDPHLMTIGTDVAATVRPVWEPISPM